MTLRTQGFLSAKVITTPAGAPAALVLYTLIAGSSFTGFVLVNGRDTAAAAGSAATSVIFSANKPAAVAVLLGAPTVLLTMANGSDAYMALATAVVGVAASDINITLTPPAGINVEWMVTLWGEVN
jgi:hypothetical protein